MGDEKEKVPIAHNPVEQFAAVDKLEHHVDLGLASCNLNQEINSDS